MMALFFGFYRQRRLMQTRENLITIWIMHYVCANRPVAPNPACIYIPRWVYGKTVWTLRWKKEIWS